MSEEYGQQFIKKYIQMVDRNVNMLGTINNSENGKQHQNEASLHTHQNGWN